MAEKTLDSSTTPDDPLNITLRMFYRLDENKKVVQCKTLREWSDWFSSADRHVANTDLGKVHISTVFLGIAAVDTGDALMFETMIFGGPADNAQWRHKTWEEAEQFHKELAEIKIFG